MLRLHNFLTCLLSDTPNHLLHLPPELASTLHCAEAHLCLCIPGSLGTRRRRRRPLWWKTTLHTASCGQFSPTPQAQGAWAAQGTHRHHTRLVTLSDHPSTPPPAFARKRHFIKCTPHHPARECHLFLVTASEAGSSGCLQLLMPQEAGPGPLQVQCLYYITAKQDGALDHLVICSPPLKQSASKLSVPTLISKMPRDYQN